MQTEQAPSGAVARLTRALHAIHMDHLWVGSIIGLIWLFISITPLPPNDLWWHMAAGRAMLAEGEWLTTNRWAYTLPADTPYVYQSWLSEIVMYGFWHVGDVPLLALSRTLAITLSFGLMAWHSWRRTGGQGKAVALALLLASLISWNNWTLRPQTLVLLPAAIFAVVLGEYLGGRVSARWLVLLPLMMIVWVNMHGSFALGVVLVGLTWSGQVLSLRAAEPPEQRTIPALWRRMLPLTFAGVGVFVAMMVHPLGIGIFGYVRSMLTNSPLQQWFVEWQPPTNAFDLSSTGFWFFAVLLLLAVLMATNPRRPPATDLLWYSALAWLTISGERYALWFALLLLPLLAEQLAAVVPTRKAVRTSPTFSLLYGGMLVLLLLAVLPWFKPVRYLGPDAQTIFAQHGSHHLLLSSATPLMATEWLAQNPREGRFWTDMSYSSYTIWRLPEKQVFADLRVELFPVSIWRDYFTIAQGSEHSLTKLDEWNIDHLLLDVYWQANLDALLQQTPGWCETYRDRRSVIMVRCPPP